MSRQLMQTDLVKKERRKKSSLYERFFLNMLAYISSIMNVLLPQFRNTKIWNINIMKIIKQEEFSLDFPQQKNLIVNNIGFFCHESYAVSF